MIAKTIDSITVDDINALIADGVRENRHLEYKQELPGNSDGQKKEFLADVSSFANAAGGDLVYGVREDDGEPVEALGLADFNEDDERLRLESTIRDGIERRIPGIQLRVVDGFLHGPVLIIRVPRSWAGPHMVKLNKTSRFYTRSSNGKFQMDLTEIEAAFDGARDISSRISQWRSERLGRIVSNDGPIRHTGNGCLVVHLIPLESIANQWRFHVNELRMPEAPLIPMDSSGYAHRINVDGFLTFTQVDNTRQLASTYAQLFRSGRLEAVAADALDEIDGHLWFKPSWCEQRVVEGMKHYLKCFTSLGLQPPVLFLLALVGVKGAYLWTSPRMRGRPHSPVDRDVITLPEVVVDQMECDLPTVLRPAFDALWNAFGVNESLNYDSEGNWNPRN